jgi:selenocysteine lyase/cysteine desulfurase
VVQYLDWLGSHFTRSQAPRRRVVAGMRAAGAHERALTAFMLRGDDSLPGLLNLPGAAVYGETANLDRRQAILAFNLDGVPTAELVDYLETRGVRVHNRTSDAYSRHTLAALGTPECIRVSLAHYNSPAEVRTFLKALRDHR